LLPDVPAGSESHREAEQVHPAQPPAVEHGHGLLGWLQAVAVAAVGAEGAGVPPHGMSPGRERAAHGCLGARACSLPGPGGGARWAARATSVSAATAWPGEG